MSYEGPERRKENLELEARVRDLEEKDRASVKSREMMHLQLEHLNTKMDLMLSRQDEKNEECAIHRTDTALLKQGHQTFKDALASVVEEQVFTRRFALGGLATAAGSLIASLWGLTHK